VVILRGLVLPAIQHCIARLASTVNLFCLRGLVVGLPALQHMLMPLVRRITLKVTVAQEIAVTRVQLVMVVAATQEQVVYLPLVDDH